MKKIICLAICIVMLVALSSCVPTLPRGEASKIELNGSMTIGDAKFEYLNERTVKIIRESDGQVFYVPDSNIIKIWVK